MARNDLRARGDGGGGGAKRPTNYLKSKNKNFHSEYFIILLCILLKSFKTTFLDSLPQRIKKFVRILTSNFIQN